MRWYQKVAMIVGNIVLGLLAVGLLVALLESADELVSGKSEDRRCEALAERTNGLTDHLGVWGGCQVRFADGYFVSGDDINIRPTSTDP
jgi:hypothetical protein